VVAFHSLLRAGTIRAAVQRRDLLLAAAGNGHTALTAYLLDGGPWAFHVDQLNRAFRAACLSCHWDTIYELLDDDRVDTKAVRVYGAITRAHEDGRMDFLDRLVRHPDFDVLGRGTAALEFACAQGFESVADFLYHALRDREEYATISKCGLWTDACGRGHTCVVRMLLRRSYVETSDLAYLGFYVACIGGQRGVVECLMDDGRVWKTPEAVCLSIAGAKRAGHDEIAARIASRRPWRHALWACAQPLMDRM